MGTFRENLCHEERALLNKVSEPLPVLPTIFIRFGLVFIIEGCRAMQLSVFEQTTTKID